MKNALPLFTFNFNYSVNKKSFLYFGSKVVKCESNLIDGKIRVVVINTGYNTRRGCLVQNLLFPKPSNFNIFGEVKYFLIILIIIFVFNAAYLIHIYFKFKEEYDPQNTGNVCNPEGDPPDRSKIIT